MPQWKNISNDGWQSIPNPYNNAGADDGWESIPNPYRGNEPVHYDTSFNPTYEDAAPTIKKYDTGFNPTYDWTPEESWGHWLGGQVLRTAPSIIGRVAGTAIGGAGGAVAGAPVGGVGAIPGALSGAVVGGMTGDFLGSGIGETLGQWWDGGEYNPEMIGVSAVSGLMPGGNYKIGKGLYELGKYGVKQGLESGAQNLFATPFSHQAERGNLWEPSKWEMPSAGEFATNAAVGFGMGGLIGGAAGKYQQRAAATPPGLGRIDPPSIYKDLPTTQDLEFNPHVYTHQADDFDTPSKNIAQDTYHDINTKDQIIQGTVASTAMPTFDVDPFADVTDALRGADIAARAEDSMPPRPDPSFWDNPLGEERGISLGDPRPPSTFGMEQGGDMVSGGDWSQRPPRQPLRGDEAIPEMAFQPDEGKVTNAESSELFLPESQGGRASEDVINPPTRATIEEETRVAPEGNINAILLSHPELRDEALAIYHETNPQTISELFAHYVKQKEAAWRVLFNAQDKRIRHGIPEPPEVKAAFERARALSDLAQAKYERASSRMVRGISETSGKPRGGLFDSPDQFHQGEQDMYGRPDGGLDLLREPPTRPTFGHEQGGDMATGGFADPPLPPHDDLRARLRQILGREPTQEELNAAAANSPNTLRNQADDAALREQIGAGSSDVPMSPIDTAVNNVLHAYAQNPHQALIELNKHLAHLSPADQRKAQNLIIQITSKIHSDSTKRLEIPDPLESRPLNPAWEETPEEAMREAPVEWIVEGKRQQLRDEGIDPTDMTGWELDMALKEVEDKRSEHLDYISTQRNVESGEQMPLGLRDRGTGDWLNAQRLALKNQYGPQSEQVRQIDVLQTAILHEGGMAKQAQEIRQLHDMYGRPITPEEEVAALAEHYTRMGDTEKAAHYNELADRYSGIQQGQQDLFKPNSFEGGAPKDPNDPNQMSQEWMDEQNGRIPPKGPLGVRPSGGPRGAMAPQVPESPRQRWAVIRQQQVDEVIRFENQAREFDKQAKAAMDTNNPELAMQHAAAAQKHRDMARTANIQFAKDFRGHMKEVERFESMARAREAAGDKEGAARLKAQAETEILREAGQMELRFRKNFLAQKMHEMGFTLSDKTMHAIDDMDPQLLAHNLQKDFAELVLDGVDDGPPGLSVVDATPEGLFMKQTHITVRDKNGKPIAHAEMEHNPTTGEGSLENWAVDQKAGMAQGAVLPLAMELEKRGGLVPKGPYSEDTKNFLQRLVAALRSERGSTPIFTGGTGGGGGQVPPTGGQGAAAPGGGGKKPRRPRQAPAGGTLWEKIKDRAGWNQGYKTNKRQRLLARQQMQWIDEALAMPANMTTTGDLSAPGRQGLMLFHTPEFWHAITAMFKSITPQGFDHIDKQLKNMRIMQSQGTDPKTGKALPSKFEEWGGKYFLPASQPGPHAKGAASNWLETGRFFNADIPYITKGWANSPMAMMIRASNRTFITFSNHLNVNRLQYLADRAQDNSSKAHQGRVRKPGLLGGFNPSNFRFGIGKHMPDIDIGFHDSIDFNTATKAEQKTWRNYADSLDPYNNTELGKELADAVNTMTGHAPLRSYLVPLRGTEFNFERHARLFGRVLFAPGLMASRIRMMMPANYIMASPTVRKEMVGGLFGWAAGYTAGALLLKNGAEALGYETDINLDSNSADFGKIRVGNYRMDPSGGMLPYLVVYSRLLSGYYTSSSTGRTTELGQGYQATTSDTLLDRFISNKQEPIFKFATDMLSASEHQPVFMKDRMLQMMAPMLAQDIYELSKEDPGLIPLSVGSFFGAGSQVYKQGQAGTRFTDPANEKVYAGGGLRGLVFGADFQNKEKGPVGARQLGPRQLKPRQLKPRELKPRS